MIAVFALLPQDHLWLSHRVIRESTL